MSVSVRQLRIGEMIAISSAWVGPKKAMFLSIPQIAAHFDQLETKHYALISAREGSAADEDLQELTVQAETLDNRHDDLNRGLYYLLIAAYHFELGRDASDPNRADAIERASASLFPQQLRAVQASYQEEAGNAAQLDALASSEYAGLLGSIHITKDLTALDMAHAIGNIGRALGAVEDQRAVAAVQAKEATITASEIRRRMRDWAQAVETILMNLELSSAPSETIDALREPVKEASEKALARWRARRAKNEKKNETTDEPKGE